VDLSEKKGGVDVRKRKPEPPDDLNLDDLPPVLTVPQAARLLGINRNTCYEAVRRGEIPSFRLGERGIRIPTAALIRRCGLDGKGNEEPRPNTETGEVGGSARW
jgi:excisionase family DNA binding protein